MWSQTVLAGTMFIALATHACLYAAPIQSRWQSQHFQDHPLAGTIWNSAFEAVTIKELEQAVLNARFILLGEIHNNPDHHRLQAQLIDALVKAGRWPAIVFLKWYLRICRTNSIVIVAMAPALPPY
jgi:uncharacterized iron-regulated protein